MKITLCGSIAFYDEMIEVKKNLEGLSHEVKLPPHEVQNEQGKMIPVKEYYALRKATTTTDGWIWERKAQAIKWHLEKVEWADAIVVTNFEKHKVPNYIGGNTLVEMGVAFFLKKKIYLLHPIPDMPYKEEILAMRPIILHNDFSKIT
jgi:hypothetical protein